MGRSDLRVADEVALAAIVSGDDRGAVGHVHQTDVAKLCQFEPVKPTTAETAIAGVRRGLKKKLLTLVFSRYD